MVWKQVGNCLQNLKFTMISIDFIVRNKLKQSNVCKEINFINYINVYLKKSVCLLLEMIDTVHEGYLFHMVPTFDE